MSTDNQSVNFGFAETDGDDSEFVEPRTSFDIPSRPPLWGMRGRIVKAASVGLSAFAPSKTSTSFGETGRFQRSDSAVNDDDGGRPSQRLAAAPGSTQGHLEGRSGYTPSVVSPFFKRMVYTLRGDEYDTQGPKVVKFRSMCLRKVTFLIFPSESGELPVIPPLPDAGHVLLIGLFPGGSKVPIERILRLRPEFAEWLNWQIWLNIIRLRGLKYFFSLKDVRSFGIFECRFSNNNDPIYHQSLVLSDQDENTLNQLHWAYLSWGRISADWTSWVLDSMNYGSTTSKVLQRGDDGAAQYPQSLEIVLGWSPIRISIVILFPIILSFSVGIWFQSRNPTDLATIQTAWGIASYVATAGGLLAALLAILSSVRDN